MNYLFYLGIIVPTLITILLFVVFVYCWFLQKARKEVMTKKYDPHGKMRRLGIPMDPPPPPPYCRIDDLTNFIDNGEDNEAYDVSRSPSTEQDTRGRPMYHTYHDSGISAGLSPSQENEPRPGMSYKTCPDSGISGFSIQNSSLASGGQPQQQHQHQQGCRECYQVREQLSHMQQHQAHDQHQHQQPPHQIRQTYLQQPQQVMLHHNTVQATVHPTHGVCYGDDTTHPLSPQHYKPPPTFGGRHFNTMPHIHEQPTAHPSSQSILEENLCYCSNSPEHQAYNPHRVQQCCQEELVDGYLHDYRQPPPAYPSTFRPQNPRAAMQLISSPKHESPPHTIGSNQNTHMSPTSPPGRKQSDAQPSDNSYPSPSSKALASSSSPSSSSSQLPRHSYRDSGVIDIIGQSQSVSERPDSQASTSSTTDSEDSGFRSSHCATQNTSKLNKQGNPLLKPLRRPKHIKTRLKPTRAENEDDPSIQGATPLSTLNPQNLQCQIPNNSKSHVIQTTSLLDEHQGQQPSPPRILQQQQNTFKSTVTPSSVSETSLLNNTKANSNNYQNEDSVSHSPNHGNNQESNNKQHVDMTEISTHLSWKYLQDLSVSSNSSQETANSQDGLQLCHTNMSKASQFQTSPEPQIEMFGYSIV